MPDGSLLIVSMLDRKLLRYRDGALSEHANLGDVATWHCNDMVVDAAGRAYVGNFGFDLETWMAEHGVEAALGEPGPPTAAIARVDPDGTVTVAADGLRFPNGTVITPDGRQLIVGETLGRRLTAFDIGADGSLSNRRAWAGTGSVPPDGICLDNEGAIWVANPLAPECVRFAAGGAVLERVTTSQPCFACMLGGPDRKTLFMLTAATSAAHEAAASRTGKVEIIAASAPGAGLP
jgi:sugar lactone lactonase YvrE